MRGRDERGLSGFSLAFERPEQADALTVEQSRFLSDRDETCRAYSHEDEHGFCAVRLTEARAILLKARLDELPQNASLNRNSKRHRRKAQ
jgi:uncharacterized protein YecT (DUF1311 family)